MDKNKVKTIVIEDEKEDLDLMLNLLQEHKELEITETASDIEEGVSKISFHKPDLIFLDINLYGKISFEILDAVYKINLKPKVVFTTAFDNYMNRAFKYSAFDYLLKPIDRNELGDTVKRFLENKNKRDFNDSYKKFKNIRGKIILNTTSGIEILNPEDICYAAAVNNQVYVKFFLYDNSEIVLSKNLGFAEKLLPEDMFVKIHRSYIINLKHLRKIMKIKKKCLLKTENGFTEVPYSVKKLKELKEILKLSV